MKRTLIFAAAILLFGVSIAACSWSLTGGIMGMAVAGILAAGVLLGFGTTQTGCSDDVGSRLSQIEDIADEDATGDSDSKVGPCLGAPLEDVIEADVGPCLSQIQDIDEADVGPCLEPPLPLDVDEPDVGPCLSQIEDAGEPDVGPCLEPPLPEDVNEAEVGPCLVPPMPDVAEPEDASEDAKKKKEDIDLGPCLSPPPPPPPAEDVGEAPDAAKASPPPAQSRRAIQEKLIADGVLPPDVAERLAGKDKS